ncbi:DoxX family protein [Rhizobium oryzicola]|uniref:DoxX family protein n=1 Tax=Rhizobium oryzicola TaxID=1232668 RepID=A0ABT8T0H3_9HYPH|nr:DoxX family protein [Rhizobium oryzicola]MDO1583758.1 DoxX family protein [Rhizobium oryzicola]
MSISERLNSLQPQALAVLRIMTGLLYLEHGTMKLLAFPAAQMPGPLPPLLLVAGILELVGGALFAIGFLTRPVAFILCGQMAVAYFMAHFPKAFFPAMNGGDAAVLYCFIFLFFIFSGAGAWAVDKKK